MILAHHFIVHNGYDVLPPPGTGADLLPARHGRRRQGRRGHLLLHLRMVLPRQGTDHQIQPETRVNHGARAPVLEPYPRNVLPRIRPGGSRRETHGEKRHAVEHGRVVVRHRLRHIPSAPPLSGQGIEGARPRIPPRAGRDRAGHMGIDQLHPRNDKN